MRLRYDITDYESAKKIAIEKSDKERGVFYLPCEVEKDKWAIGYLPDPVIAKAGGYFTLVSFPKC